MFNFVNHFCKLALFYTIILLYEYLLYNLFDFDGLFSNEQFYFDNKENYNGKDAYSLKIIKNYNIKCGIITNDNVILNDTFFPTLKT